jgi:hypothetical protein
MQTTPKISRVDIEIDQTRRTPTSEKIFVIFHRPQKLRLPVELEFLKHIGALDLIKLMPNAEVFKFSSTVSMRFPSVSFAESIRCTDAYTGKAVGGYIEGCGFLLPTRQ